MGFVQVCKVYLDLKNKSNSHSTWFIILIMKLNHFLPYQEWWAVFLDMNFICNSMVDLLYLCTTNAGKYENCTRSAGLHYW